MTSFRYNQPANWEVGLTLGWAFFCIVCSIAMLIGWVINLVSVAFPPYPDSLTIEFALRVIGIVVAPLGGIMGWV